MLELRLGERDVEALPVDLFIELADEMRRRTGRTRRG